MTQTLEVRKSETETNFIAFLLALLHSQSRTTVLLLLH